MRYIIKYVYWLALTAVLAVLTLIAPALTGAVGFVLGTVPQPALIPALMLFAAVHVAWRFIQRRTAANT